jgi:hypothetical protein
LAIQRPCPPAGPARGHGSAAARCRGGSAGAGAGVAGAGRSACPARRAKVDRGGRWQGGAGAARGAASAGSAGKRGLAALFDRAPRGEGPPYIEHGSPWRPARCSAGAAAWGGLPFPVAAIPDTKPPWRAGPGCFALGGLGARATRALHGLGWDYACPVWRSTAPGRGGGGDWRSGSPVSCCIRATVMWPSRVSPFSEVATAALK